MKNIIKLSTLTRCQKEYEFLVAKTNPSAEDLDMIGFYEQMFDFIDLGEILINDDREVA